MILETFSFLFGTQGTEKVTQEINKLQKDTEKLGEDNSNLKKGFEELISVLAPLTAAYAGVRAIMNFTEENNQLFMMSELSGITARGISELGFALGAFGGNAQTASHTLQGLQQNIMQLRRTGGGALANAAMMYGIGISTDPEKMMENIAKRMEGLNRVQKVDLGRMLGLDNSTILLLSKGLKNYREEMERAKKYTFIDEKTVELSHEFKRTFEEFNAILGSIGIDIATVILPYAKDFTEFSRDSLEYLKKHKVFITSIAAIVGGIAVATRDWKSALALLNSPLVKASAIVVGLSMVAEDIYNYFNGLPSVLGDICEKFPEIKEVVDTIGEACKDSWSYITSGQLWQDIKAEWDKLVEWWNSNTIENLAINQFKKIKDWWVSNTLGEDIGNFFKEIYGEDIKPTIDEILQSLDSLGGSFSEWTTSKTNLLRDGLATAFQSLMEKLGEYSDFLNNIWGDFVTKAKPVLNEFCNYMSGQFFEDFKLITGRVIGGTLGLINSACGLLIDSVYNLGVVIKDELVAAFKKLGEAIASITFNDFLEAMKTIWGLIKAVGGGIAGGAKWIYDFFDSDSDVSKGIQKKVDLFFTNSSLGKGFEQGVMATTMTPFDSGVIAAMKRLQENEIASREAREILYQSSSVNNNNVTSNSNTNAPITINITEGNQDTRAAVAAGIKDALPFHGSGRT